MPNPSDLSMIHITKKALGLDGASCHGTLRQDYDQDSAALLTATSTKQVG